MLKKPTTDIEAIRDQWKAFRQVVRIIHPGDVDSFRRANQTLGFNVALAAGTLMDEIDHLDKDVASLTALLTLAGQESTKLRSELQVLQTTSVSPTHIKIPSDGEESDGAPG